MAASSGSKRARVDFPTLRKLLALSGTSKTKLGEMLVALEEGDYLKSGDRLGLRPSDKRGAARAIGEGAADIFSRQTLSGPVVTEVNGISVVRLGALFQVLCNESSSFQAFLRATQERAGTRSLGLLIYMDEIKPGNVLRPDAGRNTFAVYAQLTDVPEHCRSATAAAFPVAAVRTKLLGELGGACGSHIAARRGCGCSEIAWLIVPRLSRVLSRCSRCSEVYLVAMSSVALPFSVHRGLSC